jgi:excisionase family DNA binding protein
MSHPPDPTDPAPDIAEHRASDTDPAPGEELSASAAAVVLGVNERTVRRLIHRGVLPARKVGHQYVIARADAQRVRADRASDLASVTTPDAGQRESDARSRSPNAGHWVPDAGPPIGVDLRPLVDHVAALERRIEHLTEAATVWQVRAMQAEERLKALTAGEPAPDAPVLRQDAPGAAEAPDANTDPFVAGPPAWRRAPEAVPPPVPRRPWWRRLLGRPWVDHDR